MMRNALAVVTLVAALAFAVSGFAMDPAKISAAKSAQDHEAIAAEYAKEAATARAEAERHDKMGASYTGQAREKLHLDDHCKVIANGYRKNAQALDALAEGERQLAKEAK